jgi:hypothetical protein
MNQGGRPYDSISAESEDEGNDGTPYDSTL